MEDSVVLTNKDITDMAIDMAKALSPASASSIEYWIKEYIQRKVEAPQLFLVSVEIYNVKEGPLMVEEMYVLDDGTMPISNKAIRAVSSVPLYRNAYRIRVCSYRRIVPFVV